MADKPSADGKPGTQAPFSRWIVPPGSTAIYELTMTIARALDTTSPGDLRHRAGIVRSAAVRLAADPDAGDEKVMLEVWNVRDALRDCGGSERR